MKQKEDPGATTTVISAGAALSTLGDSAQVVNMSKMEETSGVVSRDLSNSNIH